MTNRLELADAVRVARAALDGGEISVHGVVVAAPQDTDLLGRRVALAEGGLCGDLGSSELDDAALHALREAPGGPTIVVVDRERGVELYIERFSPDPELVIVGAGHIAQPLSVVGNLLGFSVTVLDDRPEYAHRDRFPAADRVVVADFDRPLAEVDVDSRTHIVLVTRGHRYDYDCLRDLSSRPTQAAYIGMIGSQRRVRAAFEQLVEEGVDRSWLEGVHAPLGLDIGAETPAEIAIAVGAEIVWRQRGGTSRPLMERDVLRHVRGGGRAS